MPPSTSLLECIKQTRIVPVRNSEIVSHSVYPAHCYTSSFSDIARMADDSSASAPLVASTSISMGNRIPRLLFLASPAGSALDVVVVCVDVTGSGSRHVDGSVKPVGVVVVVCVGKSRSSSLLLMGFASVPYGTL